jgi:oligosaccharide repeat unit polymerase
MAYPSLGNAARVEKTSRDATGIATILLLVGLLVTYLLLPSNASDEILSFAAFGVGLSLILAIVIEGSAAVRGIIRADVVMLLTLYGLTFLEFLFPQPNINNSLSSDAAANGVLVAILGFAGIAIGRHFVTRRRNASRAPFADLKPQSFFWLFVIAAFFGYLHILFSVNFDIFEMLYEMTLPRFAQSWERGRFGDVYALLVEVGALLYLVPPIAGLVLARAKEYSMTKKLIVTAVLVFTMYYAFSSGTRNILVVYVLTFFGSYFLNKKNIRLWRMIIYTSVILAILLGATSYMLAFRGVGLADYSFSENNISTINIDRNMVVLSRLTEIFPARYEFLGLEIPFFALIHPIPRALWPGKPENLSVTIESAVGGVDQSTTTLACTFIGEAYMMAGIIGVMLISLLFGVSGELWNRVGQTENSTFSRVLYVSGFFCAAISMRSMLWTTVTMLPTVALWLYGKIYLQRRVPAGHHSA